VNITRRRRSRFVGRLWSHADFLKLWTGQSISELGSQVSVLAIPWLAAVGLHVNPIEFSLLEVLSFLPFILFALPAGVWVDRLRRRPILIASDSARAILLMLIPILWAAGALRIWNLLALQFLIGGFTVFFDVGYQAYLPALVERADLVDANSKLYLTSSVANVAGPSVSGGLIAAITAPYAILADALSFVVSAVFVLRIHHDEVLPERDAGEAHPRMWPQLKEGLAWVIRNRHLRAIAASSANFNLCFNIVLAAFLLYAVRSLHLSAIELGAVFAVGSAGAVCGALVANRIQESIGIGPTIVSSAVLLSTGSIAFPLAPRSFAIPVLMFGYGLLSVGVVIYTVAQVSFRQAITPERLQGRMSAAMRWIVWGAIPLGTLIGGAIGQTVGLHFALWVGAIGALPTFLFVFLSPVRSIHALPDEVAGSTKAETERAHASFDVAPMSLAEP
jgi:MFS family permease